MMILRDQKILLLRRANWAPFFPGYWHCPTGKMEEGESPKQSIIREIFEEVGLNVNPQLGTVVTVKAPHFKNPELTWKDISLFFVTKVFEGEPINKEPRLHDAMDWFDMNHLPEPIIPVVKFGIEQYVRGEAYGEFGYEDRSDLNIAEIETYVASCHDEPIRTFLDSYRYAFESKKVDDVLNHYSFPCFIRHHQQNFFFKKNSLKKNLIDLFEAYTQLK